MFATALSNRYFGLFYHTSTCWLTANAPPECLSLPACISLTNCVGDSQIISASLWGQSRSCSPGRSTPHFSALAKAKAPFLHPPGIPHVLPFLLFGQVGGPLLYIHKCRHTLSWRLIFQVTPNQKEQRSSASSHRCPWLVSGLLHVASPPCGTDFRVFSVPATLDKFPIPLHAAGTALPETQAQEGFGSYTFYCSSVK